jgi:hypothetical protein
MQVQDLHNIRLFHLIILILMILMMMMTRNQSGQGRIRAETHNPSLGCFMQVQNLHDTQMIVSMMMCMFQVVANGRYI